MTTVTLAHALRVNKTYHGKDSSDTGAMSGAERTENEWTWPTEGKYIHNESTEVLNARR